MDFRGATIEDLDLPPPYLIYTHSSLNEARDSLFDSAPQLPQVVPVFRDRCVVGYLTSLQLESQDTDYGDSQCGVLMHKVVPLRLSILEPLELLYKALQESIIVEVYDVSMVRLLATATIHDLKQRYPALHLLR